jgi:hypothetical protein
MDGNADGNPAGNGRPGRGGGVLEQFNYAKFEV